MSELTGHEQDKNNNLIFEFNKAHSGNLIREAGKVFRKYLNNEGMVVIPVEDMVAKVTKDRTDKLLPLLVHTMAEEIGQLNMTELDLSEANLRAYTVISRTDSKQLEISFRKFVNKGTKDENYLDEEFQKKQLVDCLKDTKKYLDSFKLEIESQRNDLACAVAFYGQVGDLVIRSKESQKGVVFNDPRRPYLSMEKSEKLMMTNLDMLTNFLRNANTRVSSLENILGGLGSV